ncbi:MAG: AgmX/PglI C-terminal domain-containing protein [bacterium]
MDDKRYRLPDDERGYSFEEIAAMIFDGQLRKNSYIWEKSMKDWTFLIECDDFKEIFQSYEDFAREKVEKALGTDEETLKKRELRQMLKEAGEEKQNFKVAKKPYLSWVVLVVVILFSLVFVVFYKFYPRDDSNEGKVAKEDGVKEEINIDDIRFSSGVMKIDEIKGIKVARVAKNEEEKILKEVLLEKKKEEGGGKGLFDDVSDEELDAFRESFMKKIVSKKVSGPEVKRGGDFLSKGEELTQKQISEVVKKNYSSIKYCYDKALKTDEMVSGKMEVTIHIVGNGQVAKVINETPKFRGTEIDKCIKEQIKKKWRFPSFNGTLSTVTVPFILSAN